jgi:hypothetical protein
VGTGVVMFRGFLVMSHRVFVMLGRFPVMLGCFLGHEVSCSLSEGFATVEEAD